MPFNIRESSDHADNNSLRQLDAAHEHVFLGSNHDRNEKRMWIVIAVTVATMVVEIVAGNAYGSMALVADGWHMSTHAAAMLISAIAYLYARKQACNRRFTFGTGKFGDLAGFGSAIVLALVALYIAWESFKRLVAPVPIVFAEAIVVAVVGLIVNLVCAWLLKDEDSHHGHHHAHDHHGHCAHHDGSRDQNLRAAYLHVLADALTSLLAIAALVLGSLYGWFWLDPAMGIVGAMVIARWSWGLIGDAGANLLDYLPEGEHLPQQIEEIIVKEGADIVDLHVWKLGPGHRGAIVSIVADGRHSPSYFRDKLAAIHNLSHVTVEVEPRSAR